MRWHLPLSTWPLVPMLHSGCFGISRFTSWGGADVDCCWAMRETDGLRRGVYFKLFCSSGLRDLDGVELVDLFGDQPSPYELPPLLALHGVPEPYPLCEEDVPLTPAQHV